MQRELILSELFLLNMLMLEEAQRMRKILKKSLMQNI